MKIGDIKLQALGLMYPEVPAYATGDTLKNFDLSDYSEILARMTGSMARCLDVIVERRVLPSVHKELYLTDAETGKGIVGNKSGAAYRFDLSKLNDFFDVDRVIMMSENAYDGEYPYRLEGDKLILLAPDEAASFSLLYHPRVIPSSVWNDAADLDVVPDEIARLIPYFIVGELYREDEPGEAAEALSWFEQRIAEIAPKRTAMQRKVSSVYNAEVL